MRNRFEWRVSACVRVRPSWRTVHSTHALYARDNHECVEPMYAHALSTAKEHCIRRYKGTGARRNCWTGMRARRNAGKGCRRLGGEDTGDEQAGNCLLPPAPWRSSRQLSAKPSSQLTCRAERATASDIGSTSCLFGRYHPCGWQRRSCCLFLKLCYLCKIPRSNHDHNSTHVLIHISL